MQIIYMVFLLIILMIILIFLSGWFSGTETALTNISSIQIGELKRKKVKNVDYIIKLKKNMDRTLITILIGNNVVNILLSAVAALIANELFQALGVTIVLTLITFLIIIFGEITPKSVAIVENERVSQKNSKTIYYLMKVMAPLITIFVYLTRGINRIFGRTLRQKNLLVSEENIKDLATLGAEEGVIKKIEKDIIHKVFLFGDKKIHDIMVPFEKVFFLNDNCTIENAKNEVSKHGFTRIPIIDKDRKVIGILYSKDLLVKKTDNCRSIMRKPYYIKSDSEITDTFKEMKIKRIHIGIVQDNNGKEIGIVTLEDILEELVGEIYDEYFELKYKKNITPRKFENDIKTVIKKPTI